MPRYIYWKEILAKKDVTAIKEYVINPVDSQGASSEKPDNLQMETTSPKDIAIIQGFRKMKNDQLESYRKEMGFAMSREDLQHIHKFFNETEHRDPTMTELKVIDTYWSWITVGIQPLIQN